MSSMVAAATVPGVPAPTQPLLEPGFQKNELPQRLIPLAVLLLFAVGGAAGSVAQCAINGSAQRGIAGQRVPMIARRHDSAPTLFKRHMARPLAISRVHDVQNGARYVVTRLPRKEWTR